MLGFTLENDHKPRHNVNITSENVEFTFDGSEFWVLRSPILIGTYRR